MTTQCDRCGCNTGDVLVTIDGVSVIQCAYGCGQIYITVDIGNGITEQMTLVDVVLLRAENARLTIKLSAAEKIFNHFGGLSELSKWENAGGETAANVVQEYLEL